MNDADDAMWTDDDGDALGASKFDPFDLLVIAVATWCGVHRALGQGIHMVENALAKHSNSRVQRRAIARQMHADIEAIANG